MLLCAVCYTGRTRMGFLATASPPQAKGYPAAAAPLPACLPALVPDQERKRGRPARGRMAALVPGLRDVPALPQQAPARARGQRVLIPPRGRRAAAPGRI